MTSRGKRWPAIRLTARMIEAATEALGYDVDQDWLLGLLEEERDYSDRELRSELRDLDRQFRAAGGRGVEMADRIDALTALIAARGAGS